MDYFTELMRIAAHIKNKKDADILKAAAVQLVKSPEPKQEHITEIPGWGYAVARVY